MDLDALDKLRGALVGLGPFLADTFYECTLSEDDAAEIADALLPVVDRIANERAAAELRALAAKWDDESRDWYYDNRHTHDHGINYAAGYEEGWDHAGQLACDRAAELDSP